jgi:5-(carboxyamino)imidazole ribonucleotide mutase
MGIWPISIYPITVNDRTMRERDYLDVCLGIFMPFSHPRSSAFSYRKGDLVFCWNNEDHNRGMSMVPQVGVIMGSTSDWDTMKHCCDILEELNIPYEKKVVSAHRTPDYLFEYAETAKERGIQVIVAGAGGAAHLPGMVAAKTTLPVIGVPVQSKALNGLDSLLSIVQMPGGVPVATVAIGKAGAVNAGLLAAQILAINNIELANRLENRRNEIKQTVLESSDQLG